MKVTVSQNGKKGTVGRELCSLISEPNVKCESYRKPEWKKIGTVFSQK